MSGRKVGVRQHRGILLSGRSLVWIVQLHSRDGPRMVIVLKTSLPSLNSVTPSFPPCLKSAYFHGQHHGAVVPEVAAPRLGIFAVSGD
jgi:hypothetical protein